MAGENILTKQQIISTLMMSPYYFSLSLGERSSVIDALQRTIKKMAPDHGPAIEPTWSDQPLINVAGKNQWPHVILQSDR